MTTLIIKKQILECWLSYTGIITVPNIFYKIVKFYYEKKGFEVEELKDGEID